MGNLQDARYLSFCFGAPTSSNGVQLSLGERLRKRCLEQCLLLSANLQRQQFLRLGNTNTNTNTNTNANSIANTSRLEQCQHYQCCESHSQTSWSYCRSIRCNYKSRPETARSVQEHCCHGP